MRSKLELDYDVADGITLLNLKDSYDCMSKETQELRSMDDIPDYKMQDLIYNERMLRHLKHVIRYYGGDV